METRAKDGTLVLQNIHNQSELESLMPLTPTVDLPSKPSPALITIALLSMTSRRLLPVPQYLSLTSSQVYLLRQCCLMITSVVNPSLHRQTPLSPIIIIPILRHHIRQAAAVSTTANSTTTEPSHSGLLQRHLPFRNSAPAALTLQWFTLSSL